MTAGYYHEKFILKFFIAELLFNERQIHLSARMEVPYF